MRMKITPFFLAATILGFSGAAFSQSASVQSKQYEDGGFYEGTFKNGRQHGQGTYSLPSGYEYTGTWVLGEISGPRRMQNFLMAQFMKAVFPMANPKAPVQ